MACNITHKLRSSGLGTAVWDCCLKMGKELKLGLNENVVTQQRSNFNSDKNSFISSQSHTLFHYLNPLNIHKWGLYK